MSASAIHAWYTLEWSGGSFEVCFRPGGTFFCPKFQCPSRWEMKDDTVTVDWKKFGQYEFKFDAASRSMDGNLIPKSDAANNWRKANFLKELSAEEKMLFGDGAGTQWDFNWSGGTFPVKFKCDGYNHFTCDDFPAHSHWALEGNELKIFWDKFGNYKLTIDAAAKTMEGCEIGGDPAKDWRKAVNPTPLMDQKTVEHCEHHH